MSATYHVTTQTLSGYTSCVDIVCANDAEAIERASQIAVRECVNILRIVTAGREVTL